MPAPLIFSAPGMAERITQQSGYRTSSGYFPGLVPGRQLCIKKGGGYLFIGFVPGLPKEASLITNHYRP
jgi:hypothetical protein